MKILAFIVFAGIVWGVLAKVFEWFSATRAGAIFKYLVGLAFMALLLAFVVDGLFEIHQICSINTYYVLIGASVIYGICSCKNIE